VQQEGELLLLTVDKQIFPTTNSNLSVVIPIKNFETHRERLSSWLTPEVLEKLTVLLVHDRQVHESSSDLINFIENLSHQNLLFVSGTFNSPGKARNMGLNRLSETRGWVAFWDCDDIPNVSQFLEMINLAERDNKKFAVGGFVIRESISNKLIKSFPIVNPNLVNLGGNVGMWRWAFKLEFIRDSRFQEFRMGEDQDFLFDLNPNSNDVFFYSQGVYTYFKGNFGQLTSDPNRMKEISLSFRYILKKAGSQETSLFQIRILQRQLFTTLRHGNLRGRIYAILKSIEISPRIVTALLNNLWSKID
jgi:hypothetical protein